MSISPSSQRRKVGESNPIQPGHGQLVSTQLPEPFRIPSVCQWTDRESNPDLRHARAVSSRWTISPSVVSFLFQSAAIPHFLFILGPEPASRVAHPAMGRTHRAADLPATLSCGLSTSAHSGPAGESNPDLLVAGQVSSRWTSRPWFREVRPGIEPGLRPYHGRVLPEHLQTIE